MTSRGTKYWNSGSIPLIAPEILGDIIAEVADLGVVISEEGTIKSILVNPMADGFRTLEHFEGKDFRSCLTVESVPKFEERIDAFLKGDGKVRPMELNHTDGSDKWEFPVRYTLHRIGPDGSILLLGRDLRAVAEMQQQLVKAQMALERDYEQQREFDTRFRVLMESAREAFVFVGATTGRVTEANSAAAQLFDLSRDDLAGRSFADLFAGAEADGLMERLSDAALSNRGTPVRARLANGTEARLHPRLFRVAGDRLLICRIDADDESLSRGADPLAENLSALFDKGPDAIVFTDDTGAILSANDGFLDLIEAAHDAVTKGTSLADYLQRGSVDVKVMVENATRSGRMRLYATKLVSAFGAPRAVEISVTHLRGGDTPVFAFLIRDASRVETLRPAQAPMSDDNLRSVMELVGSATLKEIVAETTNVVEKTCIETAIELTMNNRVAAAEMLGLSRQSLYVKLRKYGLLDRDD